MFNSITTELSLAAVTVALASLATIRTVLKPSRTDVFDIAIIFCGIFFGLGPWIAFYYGNWKFTQNPYVPIQSPAILLKSYVVIILYITGLWLAKKCLVFTNKLLQQRSQHKTITQTTPKQILSILDIFGRFADIKCRYVVIAVVLIWLLRVMIGTKYGIWFSGTARAENVVNQPYVIIVLSSLAKTISIGYLAWSAACFWKEIRPLVRFAGTTILIAELFWVFLNGRRSILVWLAFFFLGFLASGRKLKPKYLIIFILISFITAQFLFPFFITVRGTYYSYHLRELQQMNPILRLNKAILLAIKNEDDNAVKRYRENMSFRPLWPRSFISNIIAAQKNNSTLKGKALLRSMIYIIPSAIYPQKTKLLATEQMIQNHYNHKVTDTASSWPAIGCADFGICGGLIAAFVVGIWITVIRFTGSMIYKRHPFVVISLAAGMTACIIQVETTPTPSWELCRNAVIILFFAESLLCFRSILQFLRVCKVTKNNSS